MPFRGQDMAAAYSAIKDECRKLRLRASRPLLPRSQSVERCEDNGGELGVGLGHHLYPDTDGLCLSVSHPRCLLTESCRLGALPDDRYRVDQSGVADGD